MMLLLTCLKALGPSTKSCESKSELRHMSLIWLKVLHKRKLIMQDWECKRYWNSAKKSRKRESILSRDNKHWKTRSLIAFMTRRTQADTSYTASTSITIVWDQLTMFFCNRIFMKTLNTGRQLPRVHRRIKKDSKTRSNNSSSNSRNSLRSCC